MKQLYNINSKPIQCLAHYGYKNKQTNKKHKQQHTVTLIGHGANCLQTHT